MSNRIAIVRIDDADYTDAIYVYGESHTYGEVTMIRRVEVNDQSVRDLDVATDLEESAPARAAACARLRAAAGLDDNE